MTEYTVRISDLIEVGNATTPGCEDLNQAWLDLMAAEGQFSPETVPSQAWAAHQTWLQWHRLLTDAQGGLRQGAKDAAASWSYRLGSLHNAIVEYQATEQRHVRWLEAARDRLA